MMKCDECHKEISPVVLVDIDGTLAEYHTTLFQFCVKYWDIWTPYENPVCDWDGEGDFEDYLGLTRSQYREAKLAFRQGGHKRFMPIYYEVAGFLEAMYDYGIGLWFTTTRPWQRLDNVDPDTREWLRRHGIVGEGLLYDEFKYRKIMDVVDGDRIIGVIDDLPEMIDHATEEGLQAFQVARRHNSGPTQMRHPRGSLANAANWVRQNQLEWEQKHGQDQ